MDFINLGRVNYNRGVGFQVSQKERSYFKKWIEFCSESRIRDKFLSKYNTQDKIEIVCAFLAAVRRNFFGRTKKETLLAGSVKDTLRHVHQVFRLNGFGDPGADESGRTALRISRILNSYKKEDPNTINQCTIPLLIFKYLKLNVRSTKNRHLSLLAGGALFFGMRSCEYLKTPNADKKQTKLLCVRNFQFMKKNTRMDLKLNNITKADYVAITF